MEFDITRDARHVIIVAMSARSGSSWLVEQLKQSADIVHFRGELTTFLRLYGLTNPKVTPVDESLNAADVDRVSNELRHCLNDEVGFQSNQIDNPDQFSKDILRRLSYQWPTLEINDRISEVVERHVNQKALNSTAFDPVAFTQSLVTELASFCAIEPNFYDFGVEPAEHVDVQYPFDFVLESPPFLLFSPWGRPTRQDILNKPIIIKSAGDVYRLGFYKALFPNADIRILHLRRNPAASINGLRNAWLSKKYQSFPVGKLNIEGYSNIASWRETWWKLDLFPGWEKYRNGNLLELCSGQWATAQESVLEWCANEDKTPFSVYYEQMVASAESRASIMNDLCDWLDVSKFPLQETRIMNASKQPRKAAWREQSTKIIPLTKTDRIQKITSQLGYDDETIPWV